MAALVIEKVLTPLGARARRGFLPTFGTHGVQDGKRPTVLYNYARFGSRLIVNNLRQAP